MSFLVLKALHLIAVVCWFAGLFYLPRLMVYTVEAVEQPTKDLLVTMQQRLLFYITTPAAVATLLFGALLLFQDRHGYMREGWMHAKLTLVVVLVFYHATLHYLHKQFCLGRNTRSSKFYRIYNELPTLILISIVFLAVVKPF